MGLQQPGADLQVRGPWNFSILHKLVISLTPISGVNQVLQVKEAQY